MVADFLKRMYDEYELQVQSIKAQLDDQKKQLAENEKFLKLLESETEKVFRDFTPRNLDNRNIKKIEEIRSKQKEINAYIEELESTFSVLDSSGSEIAQALEEVKELEMKARDSEWFEENVYNGGDDDEDSNISIGGNSYRVPLKRLKAGAGSLRFFAGQKRIDPEISDRIEHILTFILADPMRAKIELQELLSGNI